MNVFLFFADVSVDTWTNTRPPSSSIQTFPAVCVVCFKHRTRALPRRASTGSRFPATQSRLHVTSTDSGWSNTTRLHRKNFQFWKFCSTKLKCQIESILFIVPNISNHMFMTSSFTVWLLQTDLCTDPQFRWRKPSTRKEKSGGETEEGSQFRTDRQEVDVRINRKVFGITWASHRVSSFCLMMDVVFN